MYGHFPINASIDQVPRHSAEISSTTQFIENNLPPTDSPFQFNQTQDFFVLSSSDTDMLPTKNLMIKSEDEVSNPVPEQSFLNELSNCSTFAGVPDVKYATLVYSLQSRSGTILRSLVLVYHLLMMVQIWTFLSGQFGVFLANLCDQMKNSSSLKAKRMSAANNHSSLLSNGSLTSRLPPLHLLPVPTKNGQASHPSLVHYFRSLTNPSADTFVKHGPP